MYVLDIDEIRREAESVASRTSDPDEQFDMLNDYMQRMYGEFLPRGLKKISLDKFGGVVTPLLYERFTNAVLKRKIADGQTRIVVKNPEALYRIGILAFAEPAELNLIVEGDVGNSFAAMCNFEGTCVVKGNSENGLAENGYSGRVIVDGSATELVAQTNRGVHVLVRGGCMERAMGQGRAGSLVTFGAGYNSGLYMGGGVLLNLGRPGEELGPGMVGGHIYSARGTTPGKNAKVADLENADYEIIKSTLGRFRSELHVDGLREFSQENPKLYLTNFKRELYDFRDFVKVVPATDKKS
jgi:glutamate synthase domain-containing protein 3